MYPGPGYGYGYRDWGNAVGETSFGAGSSAMAYSWWTPTAASTSLGDTSRIDRLMGVEEDEECQAEQDNTIALPEELTKMFLLRECKLCEVFLTSDSSAYIHYEGRVHQKAVAVYMKDHYGIKGSLLKRRNKFEPVYCEVCRKTLTSKVVHDTHFAGKVHAKNLKKLVFQPTDPPMEDDVDFMFQPPAPPPPPKLNEFVCDVCHIPTNTEHQLILHKEGSKHKKRLKALERQAEEEDEEYYDEEDEEYYDEEDENMYGEEDEDYEDVGKSPVPHVEDPAMDLPLQFREANSSNADNGEQAPSSKEGEGENSKLWEYLTEMVISDPNKGCGGQNEKEHRGKEKKWEGTKETNAEKDNVKKSKPAAAPVLHKYKSALEAQKGEMITMTVPPSKSQLNKPEPKKPLYLPPEIRKKIEKSTDHPDEAEDTNSVVEGFSDTVRAAENRSVDMENTREPYYNTEVDFHRRKSPSPESLPSRDGHRPLYRYGPYGWGSQRYIEAARGMRFLRNRGNWERDAGRWRNDGCPSWGDKSRWCRGRLPRECTGSWVRDQGSCSGRNGVVERYGLSGRRQRRSRSRSGRPESGFRRGRGSRRTKTNSKYSRSGSDKSTSSSSSRKSRSGSDKSTSTSSSRKSRNSTSNSDSPRRNMPADLPKSRRPRPKRKHMIRRRSSSESLSCESFKGRGSKVGKKRKRNGNMRHRNMKKFKRNP